MEAATSTARGWRHAVERQARIEERLALLLESQHWSERQRAAWTAARLEEQLAAAARTRFWRERLPRGGGLTDLPLLEREELRDHLSEMRAPDAPVVVERRTSGSTGVPVRMLHGPGTVGFAAATRLRQLSWFRLAAHDHPQVNMRIAASAGEPLLNRAEREPPLWWLNPYRLDIDSVTYVHRELKGAGGARLVGAESSLLARWAQLSSEAGLDGRELGIRLAIAGGELTYPEQRAAAAEAFGCAVAELYGSHELSLIGAECPSGALHVAAEAVLVELLGPDGRALPAGQRGEVVVTLLHNPELPLLRYRLGDTAEWIEGECPCGRTLPALSVAVGRYEQMVLAPGGRLVHPRFIRSLIEQLAGHGLRSFHTLQDGPASFRVQLDADALAPGLQDALEAGFRSYLHAPVSVAIERREAAQAPGGKLRTFSRLI